MAERLTADELVARLDISSDDLAAFRKVGLKAMRTKAGDRFGWPAALHWFVRYRELQALQQLPDTITQAQFAELTGKTAKTIFNWRRSGMPSQPNPKDTRHPLIPLTDSVRWLVTRVEAKADKGEDPHELVKLEQARVNLASSQLDFERKRANVLDMEFAKRELEELVHATLSVFDGIPGQVDEELATIVEQTLEGLVAAPGPIDRGAFAREIRRVLERELAGTREEWSEAVVKVAERVENALTGDDDEEVDAADEAEPGPVEPEDTP